VQGDCQLRGYLEIGKSGNRGIYLRGRYRERFEARPVGRASQISDFPIFPISRFTDFPISRFT